MDLYNIERYGFILKGLAVQCRERNLTFTHCLH